MKTKIELSISLLMLSVLTSAQLSFDSVQDDEKEDITITNPRNEVKGDNSYTIFDVDMPIAGNYYMALWILGGKDKDGNLTSYDILINGKKVLLKAQSLKSNWQGVYVTVPASGLDSNIRNKETVYLEKGRNTIAFEIKIPEVPAVEFIQLSKNKNRIAISEDAYHDYITKIQQGKLNENLTQKTSGQFYADATLYGFDYYPGVTPYYTYFEKVYYNAGQTITCMTDKTSSSVFPHVVEIFSEKKPHQHTWSFYNSGVGYAGGGYATVPETGYYYVRVRATEAKQSGLLNISITRPIPNLPVVYNVYEPSQHTLGYCSFTRACSTNSFISLEEKVPLNTLAGRVVAFDDGNTLPLKPDFQTYDSINITSNYDLRIIQDFGVGAAIIDPAVDNSKKHLIHLYSSYSSNYRSCILYVGLGQGFRSGPGISGWDAPDCISWAAGLTLFNNPNDKASPYYVPGDIVASFDNFFGNIAANGKPRSRYEGATTYERVAANSSDAFIDIYGGISPTSVTVSHAAVRKGADGHEHGFAWESKNGQGTQGRKFHHRHVVGNYGANIFSYAKKNSKYNTFEMSLEESMAAGINVLEYVSFTDEELNIINKFKKEIPVDKITDYNKKLVALRNMQKTIVEINNETSKSDYLSSEKDFLAFCKINKDEVWPLVFEEYSKENSPFSSKLFNTFLFQEKNEHINNILDSIKTSDLQNQYNEDGGYIIRTPHSTGMILLKELIREYAQPSGQELKTPQKGNGGITYSNSDAIDIYNKSDVEIRIDIQLEKDAVISLSVCDINGRTISMLSNNISLNAGNYQFTWNHSNIQTKGVYLIKYIVNDRINLKKVVI